MMIRIAVRSPNAVFISTNPPVVYQPWTHDGRKPTDHGSPGVSEAKHTLSTTAGGGGAAGGAGGVGTGQPAAQPAAAPMLGGKKM